MYRFSERSLKVLETLHPDLAKIMTVSLKLSAIDFGLVEGHRSIERQQTLFMQGKTTLDGVTKKSKHNYDPSLAVDIFVYVSGKASLAYDARHLSYIAGVVQTVAEVLYMEEIVRHKIRWGGNWDNDGEIIDDQSFDDLVHFELTEDA